MERLRHFCLGLAVVSYCGTYIALTSVRDPVLPLLAVGLLLGIAVMGVSVFRKD